MITVVIAIIFLAILIIGHEFGHFITAKFFKLKVEEFGFGFPPKILKKRVGETLYTLNALPFGGFVKIYGETAEAVTDESLKEKNFQYLAYWKKAVIVVAGAAMNFLIGWFAIALVFMIGVAPAIFIGQVASSSPAEVSGLAPGDKLVDFGNTEEFTSFINSHKGEEVTLNVLRDTENLSLKVIPRENPPSGEGPLGVSIINGGIKSEGFFGALYNGLKTSLSILGLIFITLFNLIAGLFVGNFATASSVTGPIGIFNFLGTAGELGFVYLLQILGLISLNLTALNIIPFPALDGGRLAFIIYEKISGGRLNARFESLTHAFGFAILILLMLAITIKDIMKLL